jgi:ElaB/YqjD/DUF883 family membrane-anchored ribosome-binding protein
MSEHQTAAAEPVTPEIVQRREEIVRAREEISQSIDELSYRLSPGTLKGQAIEGAKEMANGAKTSLTQTIKSNPMPAAMVAGGLYMLFRKRSSGMTSQQSRPAYGPNTYAAGGYDTMTQRPGMGGTGGTGTQIRGAVDSAMGQGQNAVENIGEAAGQVGGRVQEAAGQMTDRAQQLGGQAQATAQDTMSRVKDAAQQNPLGAILVVSGIGAAIGLLLPTTAKENQVLGQARDQLVEQASQKAQEVGEKVQKVAQATAQTAKEEASNQNLTPSNSQVAPAS